MRHLTETEIIQYVEGGLAIPLGDQITEHVVSCEECEQKIFLFHELKKTLGSDLVGDVELVRGEDCLSEEDLSGYLEKSLEANLHNKFHNHIKGCEACFERLAFASRAIKDASPLGKEPAPTPAWMKQQAVERLAGSTNQTVGELSLGGLASTIRAAAGNLFGPMRSPVPAYALAGVMIALLVINLSLPSGGLKNLEPNPQFSLYQSRDVGSEGFSFGDSMEEIGILPAQMTVVTENKGKVQFQWNPLKEVDSYRIKLIKRSSTGDEKVLERVLGSPEFSLSENFFEKRVPYRWTVSGTLKDGTHFVGASQFIFIN